MEVLKLEMENIKNEIIEKDKEIRIKESEICDLVNKLGSQFDMEKQFKEKVDILEKKISELEKENKDLKININELKSENESLTDQIAVSDMLHDSFKERMRDKYLYNTEDEKSDDESMGVSGGLNQGGLIKIIPPNSSHSSFPSSRANFFEAIVLPRICLNSSAKWHSWYNVFIITLFKLHLYSYTLRVLNLNTPFLL